MNAPVASRVPTGNGKFIVDLSPTVVGKSQALPGPPAIPAMDTTKIEIVLRSVGPPDTIHTAYPK